MKAVMMPVGDINPYPGNPRTISDRAILAVADSVERFGFTQPVVVDSDNVVIVGHTRLLAAKHLEMDKVPVHIAADMSAEQAKAYRIMDNRSAEFSMWDVDALNEQVKQADGELNALFDDDFFSDHDDGEGMFRKAGGGDEPGDDDGDDESAEPGGSMLVQVGEYTFAASKADVVAVYGKHWLVANSDKKKLEQVLLGLLGI